MGSLTNFAELEMLDHVLGVGAYSQDANLYLALCTSDPGETATGASMNECANANSYARTEITDFANASARSIAHNADVTFPEATGSWGTVTHWAIVTSGTYGSGNVLAYGSFTTSKTIVSGNIPKAPSGDLVITAQTGGMSTFLVNELLDHFFLNGSYAPPTIYIGASTSNPGDTGSQSGEPSGNNYARVSGIGFDAASNGASANSDDITFNTASGSWGTIGYVFLADALTSGNVLMSAALDVSQPIDTNDILEFLAGQLDITVD